MHNRSRFANVLWDAGLRPGHTALVILLMLLFLIFLLVFLTFTAQPAQGQTYNVIHNFTGRADGANPYSGLTADAAGNFYGTTLLGGGSGCAGGCGTVFRLDHSSSGWVLTPLYSFAGGRDGGGPWGRVAIAPDGTLYGNTAQDNNGDWGLGTVFHLSPSVTTARSVQNPWDETVLHNFNGGDGAIPQGDIIFDQLGNIYGTTIDGGLGLGVIYELTPSGGVWTETVLYYSGEGSGDGAPYGGVVSDRSGNLFGTFVYAPPYNVGAVYELSPSGSSWTRRMLYEFTGGSDGWEPEGGLIMDASGNLYGTTIGSLSGENDGTVFEVMLTGSGWIFKTLYSFSGGGSSHYGPTAKLGVDAAGNLYGTTNGDGALGFGSVFKLTPSSSGWIYTDLHDFTGGSDGGFPVSNVVFDTSGNLYGTASAGGANGYGVVWEITP